jgi:sterol desaturase/sphingolipid hydroxylase (fatty acid hydroxylase superfamily)
VQRPEQHNLHHGRDVHAFNYGNLAIWDRVFGTWRNPATWTGKTGLYDGSTRDLGAALLGRDIHAEHVLRYPERSVLSHGTL